MTDIEQRAKQLSESANINPFYKYDLRHYMIKIATEQRKIDIEKALKYLHNTYELHLMPLFDEDFKQAMEE